MAMIMIVIGNTAAERGLSIMEHELCVDALSDW